MPDFNERPNLDFLNGHQKYLEDTWRDTRSKWAVTDLFYQLKYGVWKDEAQAAARGEYHPPTARTIIDHTSDQFTALVPTVRREPRNSASDTQAVVADRLEVAMRAVMMDAALHAKVNPWRLLGKHFNAFGYGVLELDLVQLDPAFKAQRGRPAYWNPVRITATNPGHVLIDPSDDKVPDAAIRVFKMTAQRVAELVKSKKRFARTGTFDLTNRQPWDMVTIVKHWTGQNGWVTFREADGEILFQQKNLWKFIPFTHAFAGYGMEPTMLDSSDPQYMADGLLDPIKGTLQLQAQSDTAKHTMVIENAYPPWGTEREPEDLRQALEQEGVLQGRAEEYWRLQAIEIPRWSFQSSTELADYIERSVGASARGGVRQPGVETVGQQAQLDNKALRKFIGSSMQEEHMASILAGQIARAVDKLNTLEDGIGAHGKHLRRADIDGDYDFSVTFEVIDPVLEAIRHDQHRADVAAGLMDNKTFWSLTGVQNITERQLRLDQQRVRNSLAVLARTARATAQGMDDLTEEDAEAVYEEALAGNLELVAPIGAQAPLEEQRQPLNDQTAKPPRLDDKAQLG